MKKLLFTISIFAFSCFAVTAQELTQEERAAGINELSATHQYLMATLKHLTPDQLNYKSTPESWSIAECLEHIAISEETLPQMLQEMLKSPPNPASRKEINLSDEKILEMMVDRSQKLKTQEAFTPSGKYGSFEATLKAFTTKRSENMVFLKNTKEDLRNRVRELPFGKMDGYQVLLFMSGHTERHIKQMEEIKASPGFPGN